MITERSRILTMLARADMTEAEIIGALESTSNLTRPLLLTMRADRAVKRIRKLVGGKLVIYYAIDDPSFREHGRIQVVAPYSLGNLQGRVKEMAAAISKRMRADPSDRGVAVGVSHSGVVYAPYATTDSAVDELAVRGWLIGTYTRKAAVRNIAEDLRAALA